jgi:6-pyruvoyl-tetrahydropterin synthase
VNHWPKVLKKSTFRFRASHDLKGITAHPDAQHPHEHEWRVTVIFFKEVNCNLGFGRDEFDIESAWGARIRELDGKDLSALLAPLPATSENLALWLLLKHLPRLSDSKLNHELDGVGVAKCDTHYCEVMRSQQTRDGWALFGGEVA